MTQKITEMSSEEWEAIWSAAIAALIEKGGSLSLTFELDPDKGIIGERLGAFLMHERVRVDYIGSFIVNNQFRYNLSFDIVPIQTIEVRHIGGTSKITSGSLEPIPEVTITDLMMGYSREEIVTVSCEPNLEENDQ